MQFRVLGQKKKRKKKFFAAMSLNSNFRIHSYIDKKDFCEQKRLLRKTWNSKIKKQGLKSFKKTENKLVTENGKQKLETMMDDIPLHLYVFINLYFIIYKIKFLFNSIY